MKETTGRKDDELHGLIMKPKTQRGEKDMGKRRESDGRKDEEIAHQGTTIRDLSD